MGKLIDMTGQVFGKLTVIGPYSRRNNKTFWWGKCECGAEKWFYAESLKIGHSKSCGCHSRIACSEKLAIYGTPSRKFREYRIWQSMKSRCKYSNRPSWADYGARGITVCDRWNQSFQAFIDDMGLCPSDKHSIDRIDNDLGYCPENCRWATTKEQALNSRHNRLITFDGETKPLLKWAESTGLDRTIIQSRIDYYGWSIERALTTPKINRGVRRDRSKPIPLA